MLRRRFCADVFCLLGLQLLEAVGAPEEGTLRVVAVPASDLTLDAHPRDVNAVPGHSGDYRTLDK